MSSQIVYTLDDFRQMTWEDYQNIVGICSKHLRAQFDKDDVSIDFIVPILRGGGPLAISLSYEFNIERIYPAQYKYKNIKVNGHKSYEPIKLLMSLELLEDKNKAYNVLVTEGNHCYGGTAQRCINEIKRIVPNCRIYYVSVSRDYMHRAHLDGTVFETYGFLSNDSKLLNDGECGPAGIVNKFAVFPWENIIGELNELNRDRDE